MRTTVPVMLLCCFIMKGKNAQICFLKTTKAIPIKCFVSHRPPSREGGSVGRAKKKKGNDHLKGSGCQGRPGC